MSHRLSKACAPFVSSWQTFVLKSQKKALSFVGEWPSLALFFVKTWGGEWFSSPDLPEANLVFTPRKFGTVVDGHGWSWFEMNKSGRADVLIQ